MTAPQALDQIIPGWTASLAGKPSPDFIISLLLNRRLSLLTLVNWVLGTELFMKMHPNFRYDFSAHAELYDYVLQHTKAILLCARGWNAVALHITGAPRIAIIAGGAVVAALDEVGECHIHPSRCGTLNHLYADMRKAEETVLALMAKMKAPAPKNTKENLAAFATELWRLARKAKIEGV
jgi:hypothetical protein